MRRAFFSQFPRRYSKLKYGILGSLSLVLLLAGTAEARSTRHHHHKGHMIHAKKHVQQKGRATAPQATSAIATPVIAPTPVLAEVEFTEDAETTAQQAAPIDEAEVEEWAAPATQEVQPDEEGNEAT